MIPFVALDICPRRVMKQRCRARFLMMLAQSAQTRMKYNSTSHWGKDREDKEATWQSKYFPGQCHNAMLSERWRFLLVVYACSLCWMRSCRSVLRRVCCSGVSLLVRPRSFSNPTVLKAALDIVLLGCNPPLVFISENQFPLTTTRHGEISAFIPCLPRREE